MNTDPIKLTVLYNGSLFANVNGITKNSITCYFDATGNLIGSTLENRKGSKYQELTQKLHAEIKRRGIVMPQVDE